ncbi:hypothetical protein CMI46_01820 [Candidatus Pacearchaeota archaeon]|nr:hypothetical protein [Candidatus Pacearchaeota archaeon]
MHLVFVIHKKTPPQLYLNNSSKSLTNGKTNPRNIPLQQQTKIQRNRKTTKNKVKQIIISLNKLSKKRNPKKRKRNILSIKNFRTFNPLPLK